MVMKEGEGEGRRRGGKGGRDGEAVVAEGGEEAEEGVWVEGGRRDGVVRRKRGEEKGRNW